MSIEKYNIEEVEVVEDFKDEHLIKVKAGLNRFVLAREALKMDFMVILPKELEVTLLQICLTFW